MIPWLEQSSISVAKAGRTSEPSVEPVKNTKSTETMSGVSSSNKVTQSPTLNEVSEKKSLPDLVVELNADKPWQNVKYSADNALWQGAALRRRAHPRRTNVSLGVCSADLSGPHEPTPRPGVHIRKIHFTIS